MLMARGTFTSTVGYDLRCKQGRNTITRFHERSDLPQLSETLAAGLGWIASGMFLRVSYGYIQPGANVTISGKTVERLEGLGLVRPHPECGRKTMEPTALGLRALAAHEKGIWHMKHQQEAAGHRYFGTCDEAVSASGRSVWSLTHSAMESLGEMTVTLIARCLAIWMRLVRYQCRAVAAVPWSRPVFLERHGTGVIATSRQVPFDCGNHGRRLHEPAATHRCGVVSVFTDYSKKGNAVMDRSQKLLFATPILLIGLGLMLLLGRAPGALSGFVIAGLVICVIQPGRLRIATLILLCCIGLVITLLAGASPDRIIGDLMRFWTAGDRLAFFLSPSGSVELRLGCGLLGAGLCALMFGTFSGKAGNET